MAGEVRKPDALIVPAGWAGKGGIHKIQREFGPLLGGRLHCRNQSAFNFVTNDPADSLLWPIGHPEEKGERYHWFVAAAGPDGRLLPLEPVAGFHAHEGRFLVGYLRPDPAAGDGPAQARMAAAQEQAAAAFAAKLADPDYVNELIGKGVLAQVEPRLAGAEAAFHFGPNPETQGGNPA